MITPLSIQKLGLSKSGSQPGRKQGTSPRLQRALKGRSEQRLPGTSSAARAVEPGVERAKLLSPWTPQPGRQNPEWSERSSRNDGPAPRERSSNNEGPAPPEWSERSS